MKTNHKQTTINLPELQKTKEGNNKENLLYHLLFVGKISMKEYMREVRR